MLTFTTTQKNRLTELNTDSREIDRAFSSPADRDECFKKTEKNQVRRQKEHIKTLLSKRHVPLNITCGNQLTEWLLAEEGFTQVTTPSIITRDKIEKMNIHQDNQLMDQIFWIGRNKCLRPMLAPNLYEVMRDTYKITNEPVKLFEIGSCFRKESQGARHMNEFTMLNLVELAAAKDGDQMERLEVLARNAMQAVGIHHYNIVKESSGVYGSTFDIEWEGVEIASGAFGPHPLDANWGIFVPWVGLGIGVERIAMIKGGYRTIKPAGRSTSYLDGVSLKMK